jgi:hypothetical protein
MAKMLLLSILVSMIALPALAARDPNPARGLKKTLFFWLAFNVFYLFAVRVLFFRFV